MFPAKSLGSERMFLVPRPSVPVSIPTEIKPEAKVNGQGARSALLDFVSISAQRCSAFFAEAAVLVLVLALLDRLILKGSVDLTWIVTALGLSLALLAASIFTEFGVRRWLP